jgi:multiple sugar transport system permease protein
MSEQVLGERPQTLDADRTDYGRPGRVRWMPFDRWHLFLFPLLLVVLFPISWMVLTSLQTLAETQRFPPTLVPKDIQWGNYLRALEVAPFGRYFLNTSVVTVTVVLSNLVLCSLAGYAFARIRFAGREVLFVLLMATLMVPHQVTIIPTFLIVKWLGDSLYAGLGVDHLGSLIAPNLVTVFGIFMLRQFFRTLPVSSRRRRESMAKPAGRRVQDRAAVIRPCSRYSCGHHVPVDVERLLVATGSNQLAGELDSAAGSRQLPGGS